MSPQAHTNLVGPHANLVSPHANLVTPDTDLLCESTQTNSSAAVTFVLTVSSEECRISLRTGSDSEPDIDEYVDVL